MASEYGERGHELSLKAQRDKEQIFCWSLQKEAVLLTPWFRAWKTYIRLPTSRNVGE